jgi:hypothetical protein
MNVCKRRQASRARDERMRLQYDAESQVRVQEGSPDAPVESSVESSVVAPVAIEGEPVVETKESGSVVGSDAERGWAVGQDVSTTTSTSGLFRPKPSFSFFARRLR